MKSYNTSKASEGYLPVCGGLVCVSIVNYYAQTGTEGSNSKNMDV